MPVEGDVEALREAVRVVARRLSPREIEEQTGVSYASIYRFIADDSTLTPTRKVREKLQQYVTAYHSGLLQSVSRETAPRERFAPNPVLVRNVPARAYQIVLGYLERLERAGVNVEQLEQMERLLLDDRYAKQYSRRHNVEWTEEDHILHVESLWQAIRDALATQGIVP
jgi:hypothetical protein